MMKFFQENIPLQNHTEQNFDPNANLSTNNNGDVNVMAENTYLKNYCTQLAAQFNQLVSAAPI